MAKKWPRPTEVLRYVAIKGQGFSGWCLGDWCSFFFSRLSFENLTPSFPSKFVFSRYVSSLFRRLLHPRTYVLDEGKYVRERIL